MANRKAPAGNKKNADLHSSLTAEKATELTYMAPAEHSELITVEVSPGTLKRLQTIAFRYDLEAPPVATALIMRGLEILETVRAKNLKSWATRVIN